jgi:hypothetical protein
MKIFKTQSQVLRTSCSSFKAWVDHYQLGMFVSMLLFELFRCLFTHDCLMMDLSILLGSRLIFLLV